MTRGTVYSHEQDGGPHSSSIHHSTIGWRQKPRKCFALGANARKVSLGKRFRNRFRNRFGNRFGNISSREERIHIELGRKGSARLSYNTAEGKLCQLSQQHITRNLTKCEVCNCLMHPNTCVVGQASCVY